MQNRQPIGQPPAPGQGIGERGKGKKGKMHSSLDALVFARCFCTFSRGAATRAVRAPQQRGSCRHNQRTNQPTVSACACPCFPQVCMQLLLSHPVCVPVYCVFTCFYLSLCVSLSSVGSHTLASASTCVCTCFTWFTLTCFCLILCGFQSSVGLLLSYPVCVPVFCSFAHTCYCHPVCVPVFCRFAHTRILWVLCRFTRVSVLCALHAYTAATTLCMSQFAPGSHACTAVSQPFECSDKCSHALTTL